MKLDIDCSELTQFAKEMQRQYDIETALMTATRRIAEVLHKEIVKRTPIDTGNLRKMWSAGDNLSFTVTPKGNGYEVVLINEAVNKQNVSYSQIRDSGNGFMYGVAVNDGHRAPNGKWVMGRFFVQASIIKLTNSTQLERILYSELQKWWDSL